VPSEQVQKEFIQLMEQLYSCACGNPAEVMLYLDPMHQIHNNENDYAWQLIGLKGTKKVLANTGRRRLNIIGAINPVTFEPTIMLTEENCCAEVIEAFLGEIKRQYNNATSICIILDNAKYQRSYMVQQKAKELGIDLLFLPPYSPNLNLIERLWRFFKKKVMKNRYYDSYARFENAVDTFFQTFDDSITELKSLLNFKFGIIKAS
jgi:transposase